jgi:serine/threonine-protein kinase RsbW
MSEDWICTTDEKIPSDTGEARRVLDELLASLGKNQWAEEDTFGIHLAVEEALMNAIKHGNQRDPEKSVHVIYKLSTDRLHISVEDEGQGFNPEEVPDPTLEENLELPSGRGLMLMRTFMSVVDFNERGNRVTMEKQRSTPGSEES